MQLREERRAKMLKSLILLIVSGILVDNYVIVHALALPAVMDRPVTKMRPLTFLGIGVGIVMVISSLINWPVQHLIVEKLKLGAFDLLTSCLIILAVALAVEKYVAKNCSELYSDMGSIFPLVTVNTAVLAIVMQMGTADLSFADAVGAAIGAGLGFWFAAFVLGGVQKRLETSDAPKSFRGLPLMLLSAGMFCLALMGFAGVFESLLA